MPRAVGKKEAIVRANPREPAPSQGLSSLSDLELLEGLRQSSEVHFNELYRRYFPRIYNFVFGRIHNHADAEEIVQETFTAVFRSFENFRGQSTLLSWIYGIAKNTLNNSLRRAKAEGLRMQNADPDMLRPMPSFATCTPEEQLHLHRYTESINERLDSIASWQSEIFVMRHVENLSIREISARTARSSDAIRSSLYRVKRMLVDAADLAPSAAGV